MRRSSHRIAPGRPAGAPTSPAMTRVPVHRESERPRERRVAPFDASDAVMYRRSVRYFDDLRFFSWASLPHYDEFVIRGGDSNAQFKWFALQFNYSGTFRLSVGDDPFTTYHGAYAWTTVPGESCRYGSPPGHARFHRHVGFSGERVQRFIDKGLIAERPMSEPIAVTDPDHFAARFDELIDHLNHQRTPPAVHALEGLLLSMHFQPPVSGSDRLVTAIRRLARDIIEEPGAPWDFRREAETLHVSYTHFRRLFHATVYSAPGAYLRGCRLQKAAEYLRVHDRSVADIASAVGIDDAHYFTRLFTRRYRMSPVRYRNHLRHIAAASGVVSPPPPDDAVHMRG